MGVGAKRLQFEPSLNAEINKLAAVAEAREVLESQDDDGAAVRELKSDRPVRVSFVARPPERPIRLIITPTGWFRSPSLEPKMRTSAALILRASFLHSARRVIPSKSPLS